MAIKDRPAAPPAGSSITITPPTGAQLYNGQLVLVEVVVDAGDGELPMDNTRTVSITPIGSVVVIGPTTLPLSMTGFGDPKKKAARPSRLASRTPECRQRWSCKRTGPTTRQTREMRSGPGSNRLP